MNRIDVDALLHAGVEARLGSFRPNRLRRIVLWCLTGTGALQVLQVRISGGGMNRKRRQARNYDLVSLVACSAKDVA